MNTNWLDLHLHSYFSDGRLSPEDLIRECKREELKIVALTDHESVKGIPWAISEGRRLGVKVIPGIEFSTDFDGAEQHFLGLGLDYKDKRLSDFLKQWEVTKRQQIETMVLGLQKIGFNIEFSEVVVQSCGALNRAHIAYALFEEPMKPENEIILRKFNIHNSSDFFVQFLKESSPVYVRRNMPRAAEVINLIKLLNGLAVWAHPFWKTKSAEVIRDTAAYLQRFGLDGIETCYSSDYQSRMETAVLHHIAQELSMVETGGSDFHSFEMPFLNKIGNFELLDLELNLPKELKDI